MPEAVDFFGIQASGIIGVAFVYAFPVFIFIAAFAFGLRGAMYVEDGRRGHDNSASGDDPDFNDLENLHLEGNGWIGDYQKR